MMPCHLFFVSAIHESVWTIQSFSLPGQSIGLSAQMGKGPDAYNRQIVAWLMSDALSHGILNDALRKAPRSSTPMPF